MLANIDLRHLSEISTEDKAFLSLYISSPASLPNLEKRFEQIRRILKGSDTQKDEREHFEENVKAVTKYLEKNPMKSGSLCIFSCWGLDYFLTLVLSVPIKDLVWFDSSPYIRPLAELKDEYENVAVVVADNKKARIFLMSLAISNSTTIKGNIKNHVRKGGWSQQRYERRRDKQILLYSREIVDALAELNKKEDFRRILLVGGKEILRNVYNNLPQNLQKKVIQKAIDLSKGEEIVNEEIMELFVREERNSEQDLWDKIRSEYFRGGLGVVGIENVFHATECGQAEEIIVNRDFIAIGKRCRACEDLYPGDIVICAKCGSDSVFSVDLVNEIVEMAKRTSASIDFCDPIDSLKEAGEIAAFLRYRR